MDRDKFIKIYNNLLTSNNLETSNALSLIYHYFSIKNKDKDKIDQLIRFLNIQPRLIPELVDESIKGLISYYEINTIVDLKINKILLIY